MKALSTGLMLLTAACISVDNDGVAAPPPPGEDRCNAARAQRLVGRQASAALAEEARRRTGAETVRWLRPGQIVTMEYRFGRLNIKLDSANRVEGFSCG
jgi:hypothetical protein